MPRRLHKSRATILAATFATGVASGYATRTTTRGDTWRLANTPQRVTLQLTADRSVEVDVWVATDLNGVAGPVVQARVYGRLGPACLADQEPGDTIEITNCSAVAECTCPFVTAALQKARVRFYKDHGGYAR